MRTIRFPEVNKTYAEDQPEYTPLPVFDRKNETGEQVSCWHLSWKERLMLLITGKIWLSVLTFGQALQPLKMTVNKQEALLLDQPIQPRDWVVWSGKYRNNEIEKLVDDSPAGAALVIDTSFDEQGNFIIKLAIDHGVRWWMGDAFRISADSN